jgi:hypothetical protein
VAGNTSNLDEFTVVRSDNRDVERTQLNKILKRIGSLITTPGGEFDGGTASSVYSPGPGEIDGGGAS